MAKIEIPDPIIRVSVDREDFDAPYAAEIRIGDVVVALVVAAIVVALVVNR